MPRSRQRRQRARRSYLFESLEPRMMFSASDIVEENGRTGVSWDNVVLIGAPPTSDPRGQAPGGFAWNGYVDSSQELDDRIQGYTGKASYDLAATSLAIDFKVDCPNVRYDIEIYRMGWYGGNGARWIATLDGINHEGNLAIAQDPADRVETTGLVDCNWDTTVTWIPEKIGGKYKYRSPTDDADGNGPGVAPAYELLSGVYYAKLKRREPGPVVKSSGVVFVLRDDTGVTGDMTPSTIVMQTADASWQAYNYWGNQSLYYDKTDKNASGQPTLDENTRAFKVSYDRPYDQIPPVVIEEFYTIRFLERNGYDVSYTTHVDVDKFYNENGDAGGAGSLRQHQVYIVGGHDEYWSGEHVRALEMARANDLSLMFFTGNEAFWKTRWEDDYRTLVCYKETQNNGYTDPVTGVHPDPSNVFTGLMRDFRSGNFPGTSEKYNAEFEIMQPENALTGTAFAMNFGALETNPAHSSPITVSAGTSAGSYCQILWMKG